MIILRQGRFSARYAETPADLEAAQKLRVRCFRDRNGQGADADHFDASCRHVLIEDSGSKQLVGYFRTMLLQNGQSIDQSYSAQYYNLARLQSFHAPLLEIGRFCISPEISDPDVLRIAWGALTSIVEANRVGMLFGCSSFHGTEAEQYMAAFALLKARHLAPECWRPKIKAQTVLRFGANRRIAESGLKEALRIMPPLLRTYILMGGWVSDHAVFDADLCTIHVFTGLEVDKIPEFRAQRLRSISG